MPTPARASCWASTGLLVASRILRPRSTVESHPCLTPSWVPPRPTRVPLQMDRDLLSVLPGVGADPKEVGLRGRFGRAALPDGLVWRTRRGQAPDPVHDAAI